MLNSRAKIGRRDSLAELEAQLTALEAFNASMDGDDDLDDSSWSSGTEKSDDDDDDDLDFSNCGDDEESVVTTQSQTRRKLSQARLSANTLLKKELERLQDSMATLQIVLPATMTIASQTGSRSNH